MDRSDKFLNNKSPKRIVLWFLVIFAAAMTASWFISDWLAGEIVSGQIKAMLSVIGGGKFTAAPADAAVAAGEELYSRYGISVDMPPELMYSFFALRMRLFLVLTGVSGFICALGAALSIHQVFGIYNELEKLRDDCIRVADGMKRLDTQAGDGFGCIDRLADGIGLVAERMEYLTASLRSEKNFLKEFLTDFSHQIKTSLAVVRLNSDVLTEMDSLTTERREQLSDEISEHVGRMEKLVTAAIKLAKLNADAVEYTLQAGDLSELCTEAVRRLSPLLKVKNISVKLSVPKPVIFSYDPVWLCEAIENIIKNCADHSECSEITVEAYENTLSATVAISDNGKGIKQEDIPRIFERFGKKSGNISMSSAGMGMSISRKIVQAHGGEILVYSEPGEGTRFENIFLK